MTAADKKDEAPADAAAAKDDEAVKPDAPTGEDDATQTEDGLTDEQRHAAARAADENSGKLGAANAVAQAAGIANQERTRTELGERQAAISIGNDPETADDEGGKPAEKDGPFEGQLYASDHFAVVTKAGGIAGTVELRPEGWVGPGFEFPANRVGEIKRLLGKVKNLPKQDEDSTK